MWLRIVVAAILGVCSLSCGGERANPLLEVSQAPFGCPPFSRIRSQDYLPAFEQGLRQQQAEVESIIGTPGPATFENTVEALELSGRLLEDVSNVFFNMNSADTSAELQELAKQIAPILSRHRDGIFLNPDLFRRIESVHEEAASLDLTAEQSRLLEETYKDFVRHGARLDDAHKAELKEINEELSLLSVQFGENVLKETNAFALVLEDPSDLAGLPGSFVDAAAETAAERGQQGKWIFTLDKPSLIPFLQFSERRDLREKLFKAYINRGNNGNEQDNNAIASQTVSLRLKRARLLGYPTHAAYVLEENMAKTPEAVYQLLDSLWKPALEQARTEARVLEQAAAAQGDPIELEPWDWWYYTEKVRKQQYDLDEETLRPYFQLENVRQGAFTVASRLYGLQFEERTDIPIYHSDVRTFEVKDAGGSHVGVLYLDYFPRPSKRAGAWMNSFRKESRRADTKITPIVCNVCNFSKPTKDTPALLSLEEVETLFHEFGHALHGLLSECVYDSLSGTSVPRDFVELPSQIMENWATSPDVLRIYARHYRTGEVIPDALIDKIQASRRFNQGFATVEYLAAAYLDMDWHTLEHASPIDTGSFETASMQRIGLIPSIVVRYKSPYFSHIFAGGYSSGYYSYIWSEVLDADAFRAFEENGLFDRKTAASFRRNILAKGGSEDPAELYRRFRGADPSIEALLERKGFAKQ